MRIVDAATLLLELAGLALIVFAVFRLSFTAGLIAAGVAAVLVGEVAGGPPASARPRR